MTMTRDEITQMVSDYKTALEHKIASESRVQDLTVRVAACKANVLLTAYSDGLITGKNAAIREYEEITRLDTDAYYQSILGKLAGAQAVASVAIVEFKAQELLASLTRAWLYAQCPELP